MRFQDPDETDDPAKNLAPAPSVPASRTCALPDFARCATALRKIEWGIPSRGEGIGGLAISKNVRMVFSWPVLVTCKESIGGCMGLDGSKEEDVERTH